MDRAAFLRSLAFLRPLAPDVWDATINDEEPSSGSTVTPPTPSKNNSVALFEDSLFTVVSVEPNSIVDNDFQQTICRKRCRDKKDLVWPAFFQNKSAVMNDAMDVEPEIDPEDTALKLKINSDPCLCAFEAAIVKKLPSPGLVDETDVAISNAFIVRFGNRFVFQVDESAILWVHTSVDGGVTSPSQSNGNAFPPSKRRRNGEATSPHTGGASAKTNHFQPPCLTIAFISCTFRIFSLAGEKSNIDEGSNTATDRVWGTLENKSESIESRFTKARSLLLQFFEIKESSPSSWKMAPPGSGIAFHDWPESFKSSNFHSKPLKYEVSTVLEVEDQIISSTLASPQKSNSTSKTTSSSSTHVEYGHGQQERPSQSHSTKTTDANKESENNDEGNSSPNQSSELTHEEAQHSKTVNKPDLGGKNSEEITDNQDAKKTKQSHKCCASQLSNDGHETEQSLPKWKHDFNNKNHLFETSALFMERAVDPANLSPQYEQNLAMSYSTMCAKSLSASYLTTNDFMKLSQLCENDIESATSKIDQVLEKMFPPRRKKSSAEALDEGKDFLGRVDELMTSRKEAVAAKFALLMIPKR